MGDAVKSKPLVGFGGLVSALLATVRHFHYWKNILKLKVETNLIWLHFKLHCLKCPKKVFVRQNRKWTWEKIRKYIVFQHSSNIKEPFLHFYARLASGKRILSLTYFKHFLIKMEKLSVRHFLLLKILILNNAKKSYCWQVAGFGFCCYLQVKFISLNMAAPFLLLGIGLDDTYVLLSSWRRLSSHQV